MSHMSASLRLLRRSLTAVCGTLALAVAAAVPAHAVTPDEPRPAASAAAVRTTVVGTGTATSCTYARLAKAVRRGGDISFNCGPRPVTIVVKKTLVVCNTHSCAHAWNGGRPVSRVKIDGGGLVTLSGGGKRGILYANTCDPKLGWVDARCDRQKFPHVILTDLTLRNGNATKGPASYQGVLGGGGGGAVAMRGGRLTVRDSTFTGNRCMTRHSDAGGGAIRVTGQRVTARIIDSTFTKNRCANGGALSALGAPMLVDGSTFTRNRATGKGASSGKGGNGGAIYFDGTRQDVRVVDSRIQRNVAPEGGPGIFYVSNDRSGSVSIVGTRMTKNTGARFWTGKTTSIFFLGKKLTTKRSTIS